MGKTSNSSLDTSILEQEPVKHKKHFHRRCRKHRRIQIDRSTLKCIINVNTTICQHDQFQKKPRTPFTVDMKYYRRIPPSCLREKCCRRHDFNKVNQRQRLTRCDKVWHQARHRQCHRRRHKAHREASRLADSRRNERNRSDISISILRKHFEDDLSYESISSVSLNQENNVPSSYKNVEYPEIYVESKLDTLIRRAKERDKKITVQRKLWYSPITIVSSEDFNLESITESIHSRSTLILEQDESNLSSKHFSNQLYSPSSPTKDFDLDTTENYLKPDEFKLQEKDYIRRSPSENFLYVPDWNVPEYNLKMELKHEPMDAAVYSPIQSPDISNESTIKTEVLEFNDEDMNGYNMGHIKIEN